MKISKIVPVMKVGAVNSQVDFTNITYNEAGISYNQSGYVYNKLPISNEILPSISRVFNLSPKLQVQRSGRNVEDQGISYNQSRVSYNDLRYFYGGLYGLSDIQPLISSVLSPKPTITNYSDIYKHPAFVTLQAGQSMGLLLALTYPTTTTEFVY